MRIDGFTDNKINIEAIGKVEAGKNGTVNINSIASFDAGIMTMNSTDVNKSGIIGALSSDGTVDSIKENAEMLKNNISTIINKMDMGENVSLDDNGLDINNTDVEEIVTVVEEIQIKLAMYCDDFSLTGTGVDISDVKSVMGQAAATYKAAANMSDASKAYLVKNEMEPTVENVYVAMHAGFSNSSTNPLSDSEWEKIKPQAANIVEKAGLEVNNLTLNRSRYLVENDIPLTEKNIAYFNVLDELEIPSDEKIIDRITATRLEGRAISQTMVTGESLPFEEAINAINVIESANESNIFLLSQKKELTLDVLADIEMKNEEVSVDIEDSNYISTYRKLQEIRLMMTIDAGRVLEKNGISINTTELSDLVDKLKNYEVDLFNNKMPSGSTPIEIKEIDQVNDILLAMDRLKTAPSAVLGTVSVEDEITISKISSSVPNIMEKIQKAQESYEALSTEVRRDLGDSLIKAVNASTDDILSGMGYENNESNRRAVRILGFNSMEMSAENIDKIKDLDTSINTLFKEMTPEKTLKMIRNGINPMETDVRELTDYFSEMPAEQKVEKYSEFLYKLEKNNEISADEREKYMAIYSLINKFEKDGMNAVGTLMSLGTEFTMGNLLTAYMSRIDRGIDIKADVNTGLGSITDKVSYYKHLFKTVEGKVMPEVLEDMGDIESISPEEFVDKIKNSEAYEDDVRVKENLEELMATEDEVFKITSEYGIPATINNLLACKNILKEPEKFFDDETNENFEELVGDKEKLQENYSKISEKISEELQKNLDGEKTKLDINSLKRINTGIKLLGHLANNNNYYIPIEQDGKKIVVNLKVVEDSDNTGKLQVRFNSESYGQVSVEAKVTDDGVFAQMISNEAQGVNALNEKISDISEAIQKAGFSKTNIVVNKADERPNLHSINKNSVRTEKLFTVAKIFVGQFAK